MASSNEQQALREAVALAIEWLSFKDSDGAKQYHFRKSNGLMGDTSEQLADRLKSAHEAPNAYGDRDVAALISDAQAWLGDGPAPPARKILEALAALPAAPAMPASIVERAQAWVAADADDDTPQESSHDIVRDLAKLPVDGEADALRKQLDEAKEQLRKAGMPDGEMLSDSVAGLARDLMVARNQAEEAKAELDDARESIGTLRPCLKEITRQRDELLAEACRWYRADGTFDVLDSPEAVIEKRKEAAKVLARAKAAANARAVEELEAFRDRQLPLAVDPSSPLGRTIRGALNARIAALEAEPQPITTVLTPEDMGAELQRELLQPSTEPEQPITTDAVRCFEQGMEPPQGGQLWRKTTVVRMWKQDAPFLCQSREGALRGEPGDFLAQDGHGGYYPVSAEFHGKHYESAEPKTEMAFRGAEPQRERPAPNPIILEGRNPDTGEPTRPPDMDEGWHAVEEPEQAEPDWEAPCDHKNFECRECAPEKSWPEQPEDDGEREPSLVQCQFDDPDIIPNIVEALDELGSRVRKLEGRR